MKTVIEINDLMLPPLPEGIAYFVEYGGEVYSADQMREYAKAMFEHFAELVRADEREARAMLAEKLTWADNMGVASAIRARSNT